MIEDPEPPHAHHGTGIRWLDISLPVAIILLSAASLLTAQHTGHTMERLVEENSRLVRANATPVLQLLSGNVDDGHRALTMSVANVGSGTARVIWLEVAVAGTPKRDAMDLINYFPRAAEQDYLPTRPVGGTYLPAGETRQMFNWAYPKSRLAQSRWDNFDNLRSQVRGTACFCSVLGECWTSHLGADLPQPSKACSPEGHTNFAG